MLSGLENPMHWLVVIVIAMIVFGPKRLPELGRSLGSGIRGFKDSLEGKEEMPASRVTSATSADSEPPAAGSQAKKPDAS